MDLIICVGIYAFFTFFDNKKNSIRSNNEIELEVMMNPEYYENKTAFMKLYNAIMGSNDS